MVGATARAVLVQAAAAQWTVPAAECPHRAGDGRAQERQTTRLWRPSSPRRRRSPRRKRSSSKTRGLPPHRPSDAAPRLAGEGHGRRSVWARCETPGHACRRGGAPPGLRGHGGGLQTPPRRSPWPGSSRSSSAQRRGGGGPATSGRPARGATRSARPCAGPCPRPPRSTTTVQAAHFAELARQPGAIASQSGDAVAALKERPR